MAVSFSRHLHSEAGVVERMKSSDSPIYSHNNNVDPIHHRFQIEDCSHRAVPVVERRLTPVQNDVANLQSLSIGD
jgi:hypothetical protein